MAKITFAFLDNIIKTTFKKRTKINTLGTYREVLARK